MKGIKKLLSYVTKVEYAIMIVAFVTMVAAYFVAVVNRNFIKASMPWTEEVAMDSMIYMALLNAILLFDILNISREICYSLAGNVKFSVFTNSSTAVISPTPSTLLTSS